MSSTNRGGQARQIDDFYETPAWCTRALLDATDELGPILPPAPSVSNTSLWLEPSAGRGAIIKAVNQHPRYGYNIRWYACELSDQRAADLRSLAPWVAVGDFLTLTSSFRPDVIIGNPPFCLAEEFVTTSLDRVAEDGTVAMLLRLNYLGSQARIAFHKAHPSDVFILPKRPSFTEHLRYSAEGKDRCPLYLSVKPGSKVKDKRCERSLAHTGECLVIGTDSCEYAWFVWGGQGRVGAYKRGRWSILDVGF